MTRLRAEVEVLRRRLGDVVDDGDAVEDAGGPERWARDVLNDADAAATLAARR